MSKPLRFCLLINLIMVLSLQAGTFTNAFNAGLPIGTAAYGNAVVLTNNGVDGGCLQLTTNVNNQSSGYVISDLDSGGKIGSFVANFMVTIGDSTSTLPADGFSFNFAGDLPNGTMTEDGGGTGISVEFDTYDNGGGDDIGIDVHWNGSLFATFPWDISNLTNSLTFVPVTIELTTLGTLNVTFNGTQIYTDLALTNFAPMQGRFGFGGRCGGANQICRIDNLGIDTGPAPMPQFLTASGTPTGTGVRPDPIISVQMWDGATAQVDPTTINLFLNATKITPLVITKAGLVTTVQYASPVLPSGSSNNVVVTFADNSGSPTTLTNTFSFVVVTYPALPANYVATADTSKSGFTQRIFQGGTATVASVETAETMLAGFLLNPANSLPFPNTAQTNTDGTWTYVQPNVLNYNIAAPTTAGDFPGDAQYPGMPGTNASTVNFALEAITYLYLTPGAYTFGVNSDDGFRVSSLSTQLGVFDAGRGAADTTFSFAVTTAGYYPFRLVYFQGTSAASLEWFSVTPAGQKILINDTNTPGYIPAYSKATSTHPYFLGAYPYSTGNRPDKPVVVQMQDGVGIQVNTNSIHLLVNGVAVTPSITQTSGVTTVQYNAIWASASANTAMVWFADSAVSPVSQTNQFTFSVLTYTNIPATYALSAAAVDTTKPGFLQNVFQTDKTVPSSIAYAEIMLAGQWADPSGNLYPNKATANTDGSHTFAQTNVINYNIYAPTNAGDFTNDAQFPGLPGANGSLTNFAVEAITYLYLPAGYYSLGVNSDDGFRLTTSPNPHEEFPYQVAVFDGTRAAADTTAGFGITNAGYYPFRLVYFQATGPASLELFSVALSGQKILVNDTNTVGALRAYRSAVNTQPYVQWAYPYRTGSYFVSAYNPIGFTLVDGTPAINTSTIQLTLNGTVVAASVSRANGTNIVVSYVPSSFQQLTNSTVTAQLTYTDASGHQTTDAFSFVLYGSEALAPVWNLPPGSRSYLTNDATGSAMECGMGYNPVTGHLIVGSLVFYNSLRGFYILDAVSGNDLGQLPQTNSSGVNVFSPLPSGVRYPGYSVGVADDGAIYAANKEMNTSLQKFAIYRWASETSAVYTAFSPSTFPFYLGYDFRVRGAGKNTQIIAGAGAGSTSSSPSSDAYLFTTTDGSNFTATTIGPITGINSDLYGGIAFGSNNTFYAEEFPGTQLRQVGYSGTTGSALASYLWTAPAGSFGPLGVDLVNSRVIVLATSSTAGTPHSVNLFDLNAMTNSDNYPMDTSYLSTTNANPTGGGSVVFTPSGSMAFVLVPENGIMAYELSVKSTTVPLSAATSKITAGPGSSYTISYSGGQAINYILLSSPVAYGPMSAWTPVQTNSGTLSSGSFVVAPSGARTFYRVSSRAY
jgi:hypothetical protein